jgi:hypothetical protein
MPSSAPRAHAPDVLEGAQIWHGLPSGCSRHTVPTREPRASRSPYWCRKRSPRAFVSRPVARVSPSSPSDNPCRPPLLRPDGACIDVTLCCHGTFLAICMPRGRRDVCACMCSPEAVCRTPARVFSVEGIMSGGLTMCPSCMDTLSATQTNRILGVEKAAAEEPSGHRLVVWVVRHCGCPCGRGLPSVEKTGGLSWRHLSTLLISCSV